MNIEQVKQIAEAVLYEGYLLYPYRPSAIKNRQRWTIGVVYPREYSEANGGVEGWTMQTECLITGQADTQVTIYVRFLHLMICTTVEASPTAAQSGTEQGWSMSGLSGRTASVPREEGVEREVQALKVSLGSLLTHPQIMEISFPANRIVEEPKTPAQGKTIREQQTVTGVARVTAEQIETNLFKLRVSVENTTPETGSITNRENQVFPYCFISTHTLLEVHAGEFVSLLEPPEALQAAVQSCKNLRTWPVLIGSEGEHDTLLSSPIILYDYPQIAPESAGNLFDGTEIDEILTLRILTLTDEEKQEIRQGDERGREMLDRTEALTPEQFMKLHGTIRSLRPVSEGDDA